MTAREALRQAEKFHEQHATLLMSADAATRATALWLRAIAHLLLASAPDGGGLDKDLA